MKMNEKVIIIDTDVVSHFMYAGEILYLTRIFKTPIKIIEQVYAELQRFPSKKQEIENLISFKLIEVIPFPHDNEDVRKEYFHIKKLMFKGDGESACLAVVRYSKNIIASSNLKDIKSYCQLHNLEYLTTMDFLCKALSTGLFTLERCDKFIKAVLAKKNKLPVEQMADHLCRPTNFVE